MPSDIQPGASNPDPAQHWGPPRPAPSTSSLQTPTAPRIALNRPPRWPSFAVLAVAFIALAVGIIGWFRPVPHNNQPPPNPTYTQQQVADAKASVCTAFGRLDRAVGVLKALPDGTDPLVSAIDTRQVFDVFSRYLLATLAEQPAAPADLAAAVRKQASTLEEVVIGYQDGLGTSDPELRPIVDSNSETADTIRRLCK